MGLVAGHESLPQFLELGHIPLDFVEAGYAKRVMIREVPNLEVRHSNVRPQLFELLDSLPEHVLSWETLLAGIVLAQSGKVLNQLSLGLSDVHRQRPKATLQLRSGFTASVQKFGLRPMPALHRCFQPALASHVVCINEADVEPKSVEVYGLPFLFVEVQRVFLGEHGTVLGHCIQLQKEASLGCGQRDRRPVTGQRQQRLVEERLARVLSQKLGPKPFARRYEPPEHIQVQFLPELVGLEQDGMRDQH